MHSYYVMYISIHLCVFSIKINIKVIDENRIGNFFYLNNDLNFFSCIQYIMVGFSGIFLLCLETKYLFSVNYRN